MHQNLKENDKVWILDTRVQLLLKLDGVTLEIGLPAQKLAVVEPRLELDPAIPHPSLTVVQSVWERTPNHNLATLEDVLENVTRILAPRVR